MSRRVSREYAMKLLYQVQVRNDDIEEQIDLFLSELESPIEGTEKDYFLDVVRGAVEKSKEIDGLIESHAKDWSLERMPKVDLAIMRLAIYEIRYRKDIPWNVSINEAVELAKIRRRTVKNLYQWCFGEGCSPATARRRPVVCRKS